MKKILIFLFFSGLSIAAMSQLIIATGNLSTARTGHEAQLLTNGKVIAFGGNNGYVSSYTVLNTAELYNGGTWLNTGSMLQKRNYPGSILLSNGNVMAIGGTGQNLFPLKSCEIYNVSSGTWSYTDSMANPRSATRAVTLNNGKILTVGGAYTKTCELYDQSLNTWSATGSFNIARGGGFAISKLPNGDVLLVGGQSDTAEIYSVADGTWSKIMNPMSYARNYCTAILMTNNKVLIAGGNFTLTSEVYDPATNTFTAAGNMLHYCSSNEMINLNNGRVLIYGIGSIFSSDKQALQVFNPEANGWYSAGTIGPSIFTANDYTVNRLPSGSILYAGGIWTTGNGANANCYLVNENSIANGIAEELDVSSLNIFPNPFSTKTILQTDNFMRHATLTVDNCFGQTVAQIININGQTVTLQRNDLPAGIYFIRLTEDKTIIATGKIIISD